MVLGKSSPAACTPPGSILAEIMGVTKSPDACVASEKHQVEPVMTKSLCVPSEPSQEVCPWDIFAREQPDDFHVAPDGTKFTMRKIKKLCQAFEGQLNWTCRGQTLERDGNK